MEDLEYLQDYDGDCVEHDFDEYDLYGERTDDEDNGHTMDNVELDY